MNGRVRSVSRVRTVSTVKTVSRVSRRFTCLRTSEGIRAAGLSLCCNKLFFS